MKYLKTFEKFTQQIPVEEPTPPELYSTSNDDDDEIKKKIKENEEQEIQIEPGLELKMDALRNQHGN